MSIIAAFSKLIKLGTIFTVGALGVAIFLIGMIAFDVSTTTGYGGWSVAVPSATAILTGAGLTLLSFLNFRRIS